MTQSKMAISLLIHSYISRVFVMLPRSLPPWCSSCSWSIPLSNSTYRQYPLAMKWRGYRPKNMEKSGWQGEKLLHERTTTWIPHYATSKWVAHLPTHSGLGLYMCERVPTYFFWNLWHYSIASCVLFTRKFEMTKKNRIFEFLWFF